MTFITDILTLHPNMFPEPLWHSRAGRAPAGDGARLVVEDRAL